MLTLKNRYKQGNLLFMKTVNDPLLERTPPVPGTGELIHPHSLAHFPGCYELKWRKKCNRVSPNQYACSNRIAGTVMCTHFVLCLCTPPLALKKGFFAGRAMKVVAFGVETAKQRRVYWAGRGCHFLHPPPTPSLVSLFFS